MPQPVINVSTPPTSPGRPPAANESEASDAGGTPFSDVLAQKLDQSRSRSDKLSDKPAASDSEQRDAAAGGDIAAATAPAGQILPPNGNSLQPLTVSPSATDAAQLLTAQQDGGGAEATASFSLVVLNGAGATPPVNSANGASNLEGQDVQQVPVLGQLQDQASKQSLGRGQSSGQITQGSDVNADPAQLSAVTTFPVENAQALANEGSMAGKVVEGAAQALVGLAGQPNTATANPALATVSALSGTAPHSAHSAAPPASTAIPLPITHPDWDQSLAQRVVWLVNQNVQGAELRINPPQLGPVEMRIVMNNDQATVSFTSQHAAVREALEAAVPRLRDMFSDNGLTLGNVNVSQHSFAQQRQDNPYAANPSAPSSYGERSEPAEPATPGVVTRVINGLVDLYA